MQSRAMLQERSFKKPIIILAIGFYILILALVYGYSYDKAQKRLTDELDKRLLIGAASLKHILPKNFHDKANSPKSITAEQDLQNIHSLTDFTKKTGFKFVFSLIELNGNVYITSSSATDNELKEGKEVRFFTKYDEAHFRVSALTASSPPLFASYRDRWGTFRAAVLPETSPNGTLYFACCEYDLAYIESLKMDLLIWTLVEAIILLLASLPFFILLRNHERELFYQKSIFEKKLHNNQRLEALGRLAGGIAHDFNNMLSVILGNATIISEELPPKSPISEEVSEIIEAAKNSADITQKLLYFARQRETLRERINVNETIEKLIKMLEKLIGEDIELIWAPEKNIWSIELDRSQLVQTITNLCLNAQHAISGIGQIKIETNNVAVANGKYVQLVISDNGHGMDQETQEKIFDPFFTTKDLGKGTGLGLSSVHSMVEENGGFITLQSEVGIGTTFLLHFPKCTESPPKEPKTQNEVKKGKGETLLLVEDQKETLEVTQKILERLNYKVISTTSPEKAHRLLKEHIDEVELLVTDVIMPEMNGKELCENLVAIKPTLKCLYTSGYTAEIISQRGLVTDEVDLLSKPFGKEEIAHKVRTILDSPGKD